jgi:hypothetical protein
MKTRMGRNNMKGIIQALKPTTDCEFITENDMS